MKASKPVSARTLKSDLKRVDAHKTKAGEYKELPELTDAMLNRGSVKRAGRPVAEQSRWKETLAAMESVAQGKVVSGEAVHTWLESWGSSEEPPPPTASGTRQRSRTNNPSPSRSSGTEPC